MVGPFNGIKITQSLFLTRRQSITVTRTWRERLLTWPWRPLQRSCVYEIEVPYPGYMQLGPNHFLVHPAVYRELQKFINRSEVIHGM